MACRKEKKEVKLFSNNIFFFGLALTRRPTTVSHVDCCQQVRQGYAFGVPAAFEEVRGGVYCPLAIVRHVDHLRDGLAVARNGKALVLCDAVEQPGQLASASRSAD